MHRDIRLEYRRRPSALAFMARLLRTSPGVRSSGVPAIGARWRHRVDGSELARFLALSGLPEAHTLPLLLPHTLSFPLHMAILTQPAFPLPIWRMLQVRNRILQHRAIAADATLDIAVDIAAHRVLDKGAEFDLRTTVRVGDDVAWESVNTFYARGRYGAPTADANVPAAPKLVSVEANARVAGVTPEPKVSPDETASWRLPMRGGWQYGGLSGDYNPLHLWNGYAKRRGYARAFLHPQRVLGHCLARLPRLEGEVGLDAVALDAWLKGPVFYGAEVTLHHAQDADGTVFALHVEGDARPAIVGRLNRQRITTGHVLREEDMNPHAHIRSLPPEGAHAAFGAAHQEA